MTLPLPLAPPSELVAPTLMIWIPGEPRSWERPIETLVKSGPRSGQRLRFTPTRMRQAKEAIALYARQAMAISKWPFPTDDDRFTIRAEAHLSTMRRRDCDNILKLAMDALIGAVYVDDWHVVGFTFRRFLKSKAPGLRLYVQRAEEAFDVVVGRDHSTVRTALGRHGAQGGY